MLNSEKSLVSLRETMQQYKEDIYDEKEHGQDMTILDDS
jgi:hypothetical protein